MSIKKKRPFSIVDTHTAKPPPFSDAWYERHIGLARAARPPRAQLEMAYRLVKFIFDPQLLGAENLPKGPGLFIGNHSLFALDGMVLSPLLFHHHGRWLRGLADRFLWDQGIDHQLIQAGAVCGHPTVCAALMEKGENLMVFPGGAHEATKTQAQRYQLQWKDRTGFVRMAAAHGYPIIPMAIVGPDEFYQHWIEGRDLPNTGIWKTLVKLGVIDPELRTDLIPPIPVGMLGSLLPKPQRCYVKLGQPVDTQEFLDHELQPADLLGLRETVATRIDDMLAELLQLQEQSREEQSLFRRILTR